MDVFEYAVVRLDAVWYAESAGLSGFEQRMRKDRASAAVMPFLEEYLRELNIARYIRAPIVSDKEWKAYVKLLPTYAGNAAAGREVKGSFWPEAVPARLWL